ncbi:MAG: zinc-ribbon domain-containing protein, partial [Ruminiclostridium sp.]|nr:zinc-ribbon domain-containing protein [Ruminiclostridium sp.]
MKICKSCGAINRDDSRFCSGCGSAELESAPDPVPAPTP